jgi:NADPH:quinone reductase-like Zn-dependent oxidoreductase
MKYSLDSRKSAEVRLQVPSHSEACQTFSLTIIPGSWSEYVKCSEDYVALKPKSLSFSEAASIPLAGVTALQVLRKYRGSLEGKTVFVPAGCEL